MSFYNVIEQLLATKQPHEDIGHSIEEIQLKLEQLKRSVNDLFNTPPPKKEEPPKP
jgi:archaellum component FlaC